MNINSTGNTAFHSKLDEIKTGLESNKWVNDKLEVQTKSNGFVRVLKAVVGFVFGIKMFSHIKTNKVAVSLFKYCAENKEHLRSTAALQNLDYIFTKLIEKTKSEKRLDVVKLAAFGVKTLVDQSAKKNKPAAEQPEVKTEAVATETKNGTETKTEEPKQEPEVKAEEQKQEPEVKAEEPKKEEATQTEPAATPPQTDATSTSSLPVATNAPKPPPPPVGKLVLKKAAGKPAPVVTDAPKPAAPKTPKPKGVGPGIALDVLKNVQLKKAADKPAAETTPAEPSELEKIFAANKAKAAAEVKV